MRLPLTFIILCCVTGYLRAVPQLLFANRRDIRLVDAGHPNGNATVIVNGLEDAACLDFIYDENLLFWTDVTLEVIKQTWLNASHMSRDIVTTGLVSPDGLACDWLSRKLYWTDSETNRIEVSNLDGSHRKVLFWDGLDQPRAIALDPLNGYMYWTDWGEIPKIERAWMDGAPESRSIIIRDNIHWPNGLTLDYGESRIYWADAKFSFIHSCEFDGSDRREVVVGTLPHPFALTLYDNFLYWTDWQTQAIHSCNKNTGGDRRVIHEDIYSPLDVQVFHPNRQPKEDTNRTGGVNPCADNNGGCSHLCLMSPHPPYYTCACPTGVQLHKDAKTCAMGANQVLLLARRTDLRRISLDTPDYTDIVLPLDNIRHAIAIDYDPVEGYVYWTDDAVHTIRRSYLDGTCQEVVIHDDINHPDGIAVDWVAQNLYWTDTGTDRIEVARLNGTSRKVLISEDLDEPRAIVVDPISGYMYWTDWGRKPKIERANLDGSDRVVLINMSLHWPNGLALDYDEQKLYWSDAHTDRIEVANADGSERRTLVANDLPHVFGVSQLGDYLYCTDWQRRSIERISKKTGADRSIIIDQLPDLMGLKAVDVTRVGGSNACSRNDNGCSHLCLNRPAPKGPICACPMGLELLANGKTCIKPDAFLLFSRRADIRRISLETKHNDIVIPLAGVKEASALDFDINDSRIYWTDISLKSISRAFMNGSALEHVVLHGLQFPEGLAVDWVARNLYWTDTGTKRIEMSRLDGTARKVLLWANLDGPRSIALDPPEGFMYWIDWGTDHKIERALLDGTERRQLVSNTGRINGLTIDFADHQLYWTNLDSQMIETSDLLGNNIRPIIKEDIPHPFGLTQYMDYIYWTDWNTRSIERANKTTGSNRTRIQGDLDYVMDILVFHASRQSGWNPCWINNGGCSHLCIAHPTRHTSRLTHRCTCPSHYSLAPDEKTCLPPDNFLLFSQNRRISRILVGRRRISRILVGGGANNAVPDIVLPIQVVRSVKALAFDPVDRVIYWIDGRNKAVKRVAENDTKPSMFFHASQHGSNFVLYDIAIDPYSRHLYWSDSRNNVINVTRLDMSSVGIVVNGPHQKPRSIALAPEKGLLFWANLVKPARIERAAMDGTAHITLFSTELGSPLALTVDVPSGKLFWTDTDLKRIESADFDGGNRQAIIHSSLVHPVGLAVSGEFVYWADKDQQLIERAHKVTGQQRVTLQRRVAQLNNLIAVSMPSDDVIDHHPCSRNNGGCPYLCVWKDGKNATSRCSCPIGLMLKLDEISCAEPPTCEPNQFTCHSWSTDCVPLVWKCDGFPDCEDESDELDCPMCSRNEFRCKSGQCIARKQRCDGHQQCQDDSDEADCPPCGHTAFECTADKTCIEKSLRCNGASDCSDSQDEYDCKVINRPLQSGSDHKTQYTIIIIVVFAVIVVVLTGVVLACRHKSRHVLLDDSRDIMLVKPPNPVLSLQQSTPPNTLLLSHDKSGTMCMSLNTALHSSGPLLYDRNHVTGASSSSSAVTRYPHETLNPPPSPVTTDTSRRAPYYLSASPSTMHSSHRHYQKMWRRNPPPQPTPCSTDIFEDSDPYCSKDYTCCDSATELNYDSDPFYPPPPTPRSHYFSDEPSFSPSPSTERSFFNPYPPPPSPVGMSDC